MDKIYAVSKYLHHKLFGGTAHGLHSPFVYELYNKVVLDETPYYFYDRIESLRSKLLLSTEKIQVTDYGTGAAGGQERTMKISSITKRYVQTKKNAQLLSRLVTHLKPQNLLELGTSLGLTSLYLAMPDSSSKLITLEGCPAIANIAMKNFNKAGVRNIELITGEFDNTLKDTLERSGKIDFLYIDANHTEEATLKYFETCLPYRHENSLFVFDDIHWSRGMGNAWNQIKNNPAVSFSIDLYQFGLVFFRSGIPAQHFTLKY